MYISSNWILAKALRTVLSMVRAQGGAGRSQVVCDSSHSQESSSHEGPRAVGVPAHRAAALPRSQCGLSVDVSDPPAPAESGFLNILRDKTLGSTDGAALVALD